VIRTKSIYESRNPDDGYRIFVGAEWPAGAPRGKAAGCEWMKSLGPSANLRDWMRRNRRKVPSFTDKYLAELGHNERGIARVCKLHREFGTVTVLEAPVPEGETDWRVAETLVSYLRAACE